LIKDGEIRVWHIEHCDEIKQVIEQNKRLRKVKITNVFHSIFVLSIFN